MLLVDDEHVALGPAEDLLQDTPLDEPLEESLVARADDDQVGPALLGKAHDGLGGRSGAGNEVRSKLPLAECAASLLELVPRVASGIVGGLARHGPYRVRDDQRGAGQLGEGCGSLERSRRGVVVGDNDRLEQRSLLAVKSARRWTGV